MLSTLTKIIPLALGGAVNPVGILIVFMLLSKQDKPIKHAWVFLSGFTAGLIFLALIAHLILKYTYGVSIHQNIYSAIFNIVIGITLILLALFLKSKQRRKTEPSGNLWRLFVEGFIFMIVVDISTLLFYIATMKVIFDAKLPFIDNVVIMVINILIVISTMALPALLATLTPNKSAGLLNALHLFVTKRGQLIGKIVIIIIAIYLILKGARYFY